MKTIVTISGSSQSPSSTTRALAVVNAHLAQSAFSVNTFEGAALRLDFPGRPSTEDAVRLRHAVKDAAGVVLATPEYHGGMSAMIKLCIENMGFPSLLAGKPVALLGVAAGRIGAVKSIEQLRGICSHVGALVVPNAISIANVHGAFDAAGAVTDAATETALKSLADSLLSFMHDYVCPKYVLEEAVRSGDVSTPWAVTA
jgi:chromate reductase, NAD(P)H dehydrogenase (quinone)